MLTSAYIHIPFCKKKCNYCNFVSFCDLSVQDEYVKKLLQDVEINYKNELLKTLYIGGGTPSLLKLNNVEKIISKFNVDKDCEITIELNPDDVNKSYLYELKNIGINRISIGVQSFNDNILAILGRRHSAKQAIQAVECASKIGYENISIDLMYGLPEQNIANLINDLKMATSLDIKHLSTYGLKIEKGTPFGTKLPNKLPDDDLQADFYLKINDYIKLFGFERYEISNFAQKGYEAKHNLNYWNNANYYGFGVSAHGYENGIRYSKAVTLDKYFQKPEKYDKRHVVTKQEEIEEEIFLGFRKSNGINCKLFYEKFGFEFSEKYRNIIEKYSPQYIEKTFNGYRLTLQGVLLSNLVLSEFLGN